MEFLTWAFSFPSLSVSLGIPQSVLAGRGREEGASYRLEQPHAHRIPPPPRFSGRVRGCLCVSTALAL